MVAPVVETELTEVIPIIFNPLFRVPPGSHHHKQLLAGHQS
jgi:hypothetical protein